MSFLTLLFSFFPFQVHSGQAQGTTYTIKYVAAHPVVSQQQLDSLFQAINLSLSLYEPRSLINQFNKDGRVKMDIHLRKVVKTALEVYTHSHGAFDITSYSISSLWGFGVGGQFRVPDKKAIRQVRRLTGSQWLEVKGDSLIARRNGVKIDCNGIAQGYTVDEIISFLEKNGIADMMVELGGEIRVKGSHPETGHWKIGIESALPKAEKWYPVQEIIELSNAALTSSGGNRKNFVSGKKRFTHIIHPSKGKPVKNNVLSVSVQAPTAMLADAWDNTFLVMGLRKSRKRLKMQQELTAWISYKKRDNEFLTFTNKK